MTSKLSDIPGWAAAVHVARERFGHAYDMQTFMAAGALSFPEVPKEASLLVVKAALDLASTLRCAQGPQPKLRRFELRRRPNATNVTRVYIGIDDSGIAYASQLSSSMLTDEKREAARAALYRLTRRPIANDNDPDFSDPGMGPHWPSRFEVPVEGRAAPGLFTRMTQRGALARIANQPWLCIRNTAWSDTERGAQ